MNFLCLGLAYFNNLQARLTYSAGLFNVDIVFSCEGVLYIGVMAISHRVAVADNLHAHSLFDLNTTNIFGVFYGEFK